VIVDVEATPVRVVDVGAGLCVIARTPAGRTMVYDTGPAGTLCRDAVREVVPNHPIDLLVLSHSNADHIGGAAAILAENQVLTIVHPGDDRPKSGSGGRNTLGTRDAIESGAGAELINLAETDVEFG
jgi:glyoxylase-like metal-dependent hydrolase (beta-lactamase superfamily II)